MSSVKRAFTVLIAAALLVLGLAAPASAYQPRWVKDEVGGRWGTSCPPTVEYHGSGYETVRERRNQQLRFPFWAQQINSCTLTGYVRTGYYTDVFTMWY